MKLAIQFANGEERELNVQDDNGNRLEVVVTKHVLSKPFICFNNTELFRTDMIIKVEKVEE